MTQTVHESCHGLVELTMLILASRIPQDRPLVCLGLRKLQLRVGGSEGRLQFPVRSLEECTLLSKIEDVAHYGPAFVGFRLRTSTSTGKRDGLDGGSCESGVPEFYAYVARHGF